jgi:hypothetical protein
MTPPLGLDVQAAYEASLRFALARRAKAHRPEHLALMLVALDPGARWVLGDRADAVLAGLARAYPPPGRNRVLRRERRVGRIVRVYQRTCGRVAAPADGLGALIAG